MMNFHRKPCQNLNFYSNYLSRINKTEHSKNISFEVDEKICQSKNILVPNFFYFKIYYLGQTKRNISTKKIGRFYRKRSQEIFF